MIREGYRVNATGRIRLEWAVTTGLLLIFCACSRTQSPPPVAASPPPQTAEATEPPTPIEPRLGDAPRLPLEQR
jgi:hypothetical protein